MDLITTIDIAVLFQGLILGGLILLNKPTGGKAYVYLGLHILLLSLVGIATLIEELGVYETHPFLYFLPVNFFLSFPVFLYLYAKEISGLDREEKLKRKLLPGIIEFTTWSVLFILTILGVEINPEGEVYLLFEDLYYLFVFFFLGYYLIKIIRFITKVNKAAENRFSSLEHKTLSWLRVGCILLLLIFALDLSEAFMENEAGHGVWLDYLDTAVSAGIVLWLAFHGYRQTVILSYKKSITTEISDSNVIAEKTVEPKVISLEGDKKLYESVVEKVEGEQLYKRQELTLNELAEEIGIHQKQLSFLINQFAEKNFFNFINSFRVREAQELLLDDNYSHLSFLGIAFEAGFNSKATFNATFKRITGQTPRQYKLSKQSA